MKILMSGHGAGPDGHYHSGQTYDLHPELARQLVATKEALPADALAEAEFAALQAAFEAEDPETASLRSKGKKA